MQLLIGLVLNSLALIITTYIVPGFEVADFPSAILAAIVLGVLNTFIKPILLFLTAPINLLTIGLFTFVVNAMVLALAAWIVPGLDIENFFPTGILAALVLSVVSTILTLLAKDIANVKK